jgi:hypothetical protein
VSTLLRNVFTSIYEHLSKHDYTAVTRPGYDWLRKALHPAVPDVKAPRCPANTVRATATQETTTTFTLTCPSSITADTWDFRLVMKNDPLCPISVEAGNMNYTVLNQTFYDQTPFAVHNPDDFKATVKAFRNAAEQYRVCALSVTGYFVGASMTDQGSIIAAQFSDGTFEAMCQKSSTYSYVPLLGFGQAVPGTDQLTMGTNSYVSPAKEGFYMPYKMQNPEAWHRTDRLYACRRYNAGLNLDGEEDLNVGWTPYPLNNSVASPGTGVNRFQTLWPAPCDEGMGVVVVNGLARTSSFRITVRVAIEMMTRPTSNFATFCETPALPDWHAITMYSEIVARLKDAYPSRDNSLGTLWAKVKKIASGIWHTVSPAIAAGVPALAPVVAGMNAASGFIKSLSQKEKPAAQQTKNTAPLTVPKVTFVPVKQMPPQKTVKTVKAQPVAVAPTPLRIVRNGRVL